MQARVWPMSDPTFWLRLPPSMNATPPKRLATQERPCRRRNEAVNSPAAEKEGQEVRILEE